MVLFGAMRQHASRRHFIMFQNYAMRCAQCVQGSPLQGASPLPGIVVFDLDYCLWPYWCEMKTARDKATLYPESLAVLNALRCAALRFRMPDPNTCMLFIQCERKWKSVAHTLKHCGRAASVKMALASRTPTPEVAGAFLQQLGKCVGCEPPCSPSFMCCCVSHGAGV